MQLHRKWIFNIRNGYDQKEDVENLLKENKNYSEIKTIQDLSGNDRCVIAKVGKI